MIRQESIFQNKKFIGVLSIAEWGVTFNPEDHRAAFQKVRLKTWETVEAAKAEVLRKANQEVSAR